MCHLVTGRVSRSCGKSASECRSFQTRHTHTLSAACVCVCLSMFGGKPFPRDALFYLCSGVAILRCIYRLNMEEFKTCERKVGIMVQQNIFHPSSRVGLTQRDRPPLTLTCTPTGNLDRLTFTACPENPDRTRTEPRENPHCNTANSTRRPVVPGNQTPAPLGLTWCTTSPFKHELNVCRVCEAPFVQRYNIKK